jgi:hypothetical protein
MGLLTNSDHEKRLARLELAVEQFMTATIKALEVQDQKIATLKEHCAVLNENNQTVQELVTRNASDNIKMMSDMENLATIFNSLTGKEVPRKSSSQ